ncbi:MULTISPECIES: hypothetical protein [Methylocystis]|uniref:Uncharacterized protein n=1 Tax=Methylocystis iwaonis TaxID=2885079 RepID=A0ABN6VBG3_9HYPH|nr:MULTISPECIES: hypothetical protein [Methylocystis]MBL1258635.1 hypothetical protein [Methylocystis sp. Sn-Cys]BDV33030.1 hypothetical protein SS37A_05590 [Methylocystis iwaonis]
MPSRTPQPITEILSRISAELIDLAQSVDRLHSLAQSVDGPGKKEKDAFLQEAQSIDLIEQRLSSLSHFLVELVEIIPPEWEVIGKAAAQKLKLSALAHRLSAPEGHVHPSHASGELEIF